jgi:NAD+ kinase
MNPIFRQVALIGKYHAAVAPPLAASMRAGLEEIAQFLGSQGCEVVVERDTASIAGLADYPTADVAGIGRDCDLGLVVGGDGTMLGIGRQLARHDVPLIGINQGRLGFITDIPLDKYRTVLPPMLAGQYEEERRTLIHATVVRDGSTVFEALAMNDVVVNRGATSGMVELRVEVDGHFVANQRADGLIVATPTGSTAYSLSAGGPIVHPSVDCTLLTPICSHALTHRSTLVPADRTIRITLCSESADTFLPLDGQTGHGLQCGDSIEVVRSPNRVQLLRDPGVGYFSILRKKLHWGER